MTYFIPLLNSPDLGKFHVVLCDYYEIELYLFRYWFSQKIKNHRPWNECVSTSDKYDACILVTNNTNIPNTDSNGALNDVILRSLETGEQICSRRTINRIKQTNQISPSSDICHISVPCVLDLSGQKANLKPKVPPEAS